MKKHDVFLSLGSNIDNPQENLKNAIKALSESRGIEIVKESSFYRTSPVDFLHQPEFINCILWIRTGKNIHRLLEFLKKLEVQLGREEGFYKGPRKIDLDIIFYSDEVIKTSDLSIPHKRMHQRRFVLIPLCELNNQLVHPELGKTVQQLLDSLEENPLQQVTKLESAD